MALLDSNQRQELIEKLAENATDAADMDMLISFFYEHQYNYFEDMTDEDLLNEAVENGLTDSDEE